MIKVTFTLDADTVDSLDRVASRLSMPKSQVVREAIRLYGEQIGRLTEEEKCRLLRVFDEVTGPVPDRGRVAVEAELAEIRRARRAGGRRSPQVLWGRTERGGDDSPGKPGDPDPRSGESTPRRGDPEAGRP